MNQAIECQTLIPKQNTGLSLKYSALQQVVNQAIGCQALIPKQNIGLSPKYSALQQVVNQAIGCQVLIPKQNTGLGINLGRIEMRIIDTLIISSILPACFSMFWDINLRSEVLL